MKNKLCKDVCKRCYRERGHSWWFESEDKDWKERNIVYCSSVSSEYFGKWKDLDSAFQDCPYKLEHLVIGSQDET